MNHADFMAMFKDECGFKRNQVELALILSKDAHRPQRRRDGERYSNHPRRVAVIFWQELGWHRIDAVIAALLHDTIEDTLYIHAGNLRQWFSGYVSRIVCALTRKARVQHVDDDGGLLVPAPRTSKDYYDGLMCDGLAAAIKGCDTLDNLRSLKGMDDAFKTKTIAKGRRILKVLAHHQEHGSFWDMDKFTKLRQLIGAEIDKLEE